LVYPRLIRHELGHAMGYYHTDDVGDVMYGRSISTRSCDLLPSDRERRHARFAHQ
jgi:predicted Zn-dependent protease